MRTRLQLLVIFAFSIFFGCEEKIESPDRELGLEYQPLGIGYFWIYQVDQTIYFGENDSETSSFFYRDFIRGSYLNEEKNIVYIVERSKSSNRVNWVKELEYTLQNRNNSIVRTINNQPVVVLVFPPAEGLLWNGKIYQAEGSDDFQIDQVGNSELPSFSAISSVRVNQEDQDDKITSRDIRYEVFGKEVGLLEKYDDVVTYCSRNDCLGQQLINSGSKTYLKLVEYGTK
jgi:hypothetical protein